MTTILLAAAILLAALLGVVWWAVRWQDERELTRSVEGDE